MNDFVTGYFYDEEGVLFQWYAGINPEDLIEDKEAAVGFILSDHVDTNYYRFDFDNSELKPYVPTGEYS
jgi:hypothetical protein|tara:strand:+ start:178 stop:384 length:207 start_codon:yes stop_codon:yes gene_type:complete